MQLIKYLKHAFVNRMGLCVLMLIMYASVILFAWYTGASPVIKRDQWHHLTMLTEYFNTGFDFSLLTLAHGGHFQPGYNAWFILNGAWFGLNTQLELFLGIFFLGVFVVILFKEFNASLKHNSTPFQRQLMFILMLMVALSFNQIIGFTYSLSSFIGFLSALLSMLFASLLSKFLTSCNAVNSHVLIMAIVLLLLSAGFAGGSWVIYIGAAVITICSWVVTHRPDKKRVLVLGGAILAMAIATLWIKSISSGIPANTNTGISHILQHPGQAVAFMLVLFTNGLFKINWFYQAGLFEYVYVIGSAIACSSLAGLYLFYKTRMWEKTYAPLYLMSFFWIFALALLIYRLPTYGVAGAAYPRYSTALQIGLLGVLWVIIYWAKSLPSSKANVMWFVVGLAIGIPYIHNLYSAIKTAPYIRIANAKMVGIVLSEKFDQGGEVCPNENLCRQGVVTLKEHRLNIYRNRVEPIPPKDITIKFKKWGPQSTKLGIVPNTNSSGNAGLWFQLEVDPGLGQVQAYFDGVPVDTRFKNLLITASIPAKQFNKPGAKKIVVRQVSTGKDFAVGEFVVIAK